MKKLKSDEKEVINFTFGVIGDLAKGKCLKEEIAGAVITFVANSIDQSNLTHCNNGLLCITDLICNYQSAGVKFTSSVMEMALKIVTKPNVLLLITLDLKDLLSQLLQNRRSTLRSRPRDWSQVLPEQHEAHLCGSEDQ